MGERIIPEELLDQAINQIYCNYGGDCNIVPEVVIALVKHPRADEFYGGHFNLLNSKTNPEMETCYEAIKTNRAIIIDDVEKATGITVHGENIQAASTLWHLLNDEQTLIT